MNIGTLAQIACILEATARKPGNVHREADFAGDAHYLDFLLSATAIAEPMNRAREIGVGATVLAAVKSTREVVSTNTNLGMILLMAPLACVAEGDLQAGVGKVLEGLTVEDARLVYQAIRLAGAGGMGEVAEQDLREEPTVTLLEAMRLASGRDLVARQYATGYEDVFGITLPALFVGESGSLASPLSKGGLRGVGFGAEVGGRSSEFTPPGPPLEQGGRKTGGEVEASGEVESNEFTPPSPPFQRGGTGEEGRVEFPPPAPPLEQGGRQTNSEDLESAIVRAYLVTLANRPDSLIARKRGEAVAVEASRRAAEVLAGGEIAGFDAWLRGDGHARNPGATADLVAAALFVALLDGTIQLPGKGSGWDGLKPQRS